MLKVEVYKNENLIKRFFCEEVEQVLKFLNIDAKFKRHLYEECMNSKKAEIGLDYEFYLIVESLDDEPILDIREYCFYFIDGYCECLKTKCYGYKGCPFRKKEKD